MRFKALTHWVLATGILLGALPSTAMAQGRIEAVWAPRHVRFIYQGFTTQYSCDGLREDIRTMLIKLGAHDLKIRSYGCTRLVGVEPFPGVQVTMQVLVPAESAKGKQSGPTVTAKWQNVVLMPDNASFEEQGNCELIEQFKETFLPLFTTRHISYRSTCVPHQIMLGTHLSAEVLMPEAKPRARH